MPNDHDSNLSLTWARAGVETANGVHEALLWWLTGGVSLLLWTGLALLLTNA